MSVAVAVRTGPTGAGEPGPWVGISPIGRDAMPHRKLNRIAIAHRQFLVFIQFGISPVLRTVGGSLFLETVPLGSASCSSTSSPRLITSPSGSA